MAVGVFACTPKITPNLPSKITTDQSYLFYLHGGVVQAQGIPAVSSYYGRYEYLKILKTLRSHDFYVISEVRPKDTQEDAYARKVSAQIDSLILSGVPASNIYVVGASLGAYITVDLAHMRQQPDMNYALLGLCSEYALDYYQKYKGKLCGNFLSIYETSDSKGPCQSIFIEPQCGYSFEEKALNMGIDHAFLFKPYDEWVKPLVAWTKSTKR